MFLYWTFTGKVMTEVAINFQCTLLEKFKVKLDYGKGFILWKLIE